ncbi:MAG: hypothetical protein U0R52_04190 [Solirubrobacterales bacterium]
MSPPPPSRLEGLLARPVERPDPEVGEAIERGPIPAGAALALGEVDRLLDPAPLGAENGWCTLPDGIGYVAVRTTMPAVSGEMVDWWFDWHPREAIRYRVWHPLAHRGNSLEPPSLPGPKPHWGAVHHPVEDIGTGTVHARIRFCPPTALGFSSDCLDDPRVATVVCGRAGDDRSHVEHTPMAHVFLRNADGVVLRSRFWLGAAIRPYLPGPLDRLAGSLLNNRLVRRAALPRGLPQALARHCAEEFANLAALLPGLYGEYAG